MSWNIYGPHGPEGPQGPRGLTWRNAGWVTATVYEEDDALQHNGTSYRATAAHTSGATTEPGVGVDWATVWKIVAEKGDTGSIGTVTLDDLTDVDTTGVADDEVLGFDSGAGLWVPKIAGGV